MPYETWTPELVFSAHNSEVELLEAKVRTAKIVTALASVPTWVLGNAGWFFCFYYFRFNSFILSLRRTNHIWGKHCVAHSVQC